MKITDISLQAKNKDRVNVSIDGKYRFSLDVFQVGELGIKIGNEYKDSELYELETEGEFSKLYTRALEYCLMRPHSAREVRDYLWRKTRKTRYKSRQTGEIKEREGVSAGLTERVYQRLLEKGYIDDGKFTRFWVENRNQTKGSSRRKLENELRAKGIEPTLIQAALDDSSRSDEQEVQKVLAKKRAKYPDEQKLIQYLLRQGFSYNEVRRALQDSE